MRMKRKIGALLLTGAMMTCLISGCSGEKSVLDPKNPVSVEFWHYYNGPQKIALDSLISKFNSTVGKEKGIVVEGLSQGKVNELTSKVLDSANKKVGAPELPDMFAAYADTVYQVDQLGLVAPLDEYFTKDELSQYVEGYLEEGRFDQQENLKIFPTAKSTEVMLLNKTDWDKFSAATGASLDSLKTMEGVAKVSKQYYEWTDAQTTAKDDGKAFFGRDAFANYMIIGSRQLGMEIFSVKDAKVNFQLDSKVLRKLWDNYYVPYISGYYSDGAQYRTDEIKIGDLVACVGSTAGASYFPDKVTAQDDTTHDITMQAFAAPEFDGGENYAVQQGAGIALIKSDKQHETACAEFLKWFTQSENNTEFAITSGYLPVKNEANNDDYIQQTIEKLSGEKLSVNLQKSVLASAGVVRSSKLYTNKAFKGGTEARGVLENSMPDKAHEDLKAINELIKQGSSKADAIAKYNTDENFNSWVESLKQDLQACVK